MRRQVLIGAVSLGIALFAVMAITTIASPITDPVQPEPLTEEDEDRRVSFEEYESGIWPYLSKEQSFRRTSPINVVVRGDTNTVLRILRDRGPGDWQDTPPDEQGAAPGEQFRGGENDTEREGVDQVAIDWESTEGATRYAYVDDGEEGRWVDETAQLHDGDYYGHRYHVRVYESPNESEPWVAMQAHSEHFDWFTLRHAVHGTQDAQDRVERAFFDDPRVRQVWREYVANDDSSDSDGWTSMVELVLVASVLLSGGLPARSLRFWWGARVVRRHRHPDRREVEGLRAEQQSGRHGDSGEFPGSQSRIDELLQRHLTPVDRRRLRSIWERLSIRKAALAGSIAAILLGVRLAGILLERHADFLTMHQIAAMLYPAIAVGIPLATYVLAGGIERRMDAATTASVGMAAGVLMDYAYVGLDVIPIVVLLQRVAVIVALGLIAGGAAKRAARESRINGLVITGVVLWVVLLTATLLGQI